MFRYPLHGLAGAVVLGAVLTSTWSTALMSQQAQPRSSVRANPLLTKSPLPFEAPPFDRIQDGDFASAFEAGMKRQLEEIAAIAESPAAPTFENTLVALEKSGQLLERVSLVFNGLTSANTNPALQKTPAGRCAEARGPRGRHLSQCEVVQPGRRDLRTARRAEPGP